MHKSGHEHHVVLPYKAPHAINTLEQGRHVMLQPLQSCALEHKVHLISRASPT